MKLVCDGKILDILFKLKSGLGQIHNLFLSKIDNFFEKEYLL